MSAESTLRERLDDPDESVRAFAVEDAGFDARAEDVPVLAGRLGLEGSRFVREAIVAALARMRHAVVIDQAIAMLASEDAFVRNAGVELLQAAGTGAVGRIEEAFGSAGADVRKLLLDAASGMAGREAEDALVLGLDDPDINVRIAAVEYLADRARPELKPRFEAIVRAEREPMLLAAALTALEAVGDAASWAVIEERSQSPDGLPSFLQPQVLRVMAKCGVESCLDRLFAEHPRIKPGTLADWIDALEIFHERHAFRALTSPKFEIICGLLGSAPSSMCRFRLLKWMGKLDQQPGLLDELTKNLESPDTLVRHGAALGLAIMGTGDAVEALSRRLPAERDGEVRSVIQESVASATGGRP